MRKRVLKGGRTSSLKRIRVFLALLFFVGICLVFIDIHGAVPKWIYNRVIYFQLVPSLIFALKVFSFAASGFIVVILLTLLFGRVYCSTLCPLGILMDIIGRVVKRVKIKTDHRYKSPHTFVRYLLLTVTALSFISGMFIINLLDPFSNFGRVSTSLLKPIVSVFNNGVVYILEFAGSYALSPYKVKTVHMGTVVFSSAFLILITGLTIKGGRLYCNMICPVGSLLGLLSKISLFKIGILHRECNGCKLCEKSCKSDCINIDKGFIDQSRCVTCFNCIGSCTQRAVTYRPVKNNLKDEIKSVRPTHTRRQFITAFAMALSLLPKSSRGAKNIKITVPNKIPVPKKAHPIVPPGGVSLDNFTNLCLGCHACVARCPSQVLQPSITEYGLTGLFMPYLDPGTAFCEPKCIECGQVCPTDAISGFSLEKKKQMQLGVVKFIRDNCIVVLQKTDCGACSEHCPTKAVFMVKEGKVRVPRVNEKICLGCGACEFVCPSKPNKAIYVKPHAVHKHAEAPPIKKPKETFQPKDIDDFPF